MNDSRLGLGAELVPGTGARILEELDQVRPVILLADHGHPAARLAAMSAYSMSARLFPNSVLEGRGSAPSNPWGALAVEDLPARLAGAIPAATASPSRDIRVAIGDGGPADLYLGGDDWTAVIDRDPVPIQASALPIGLQAAAVLASSHLANGVLGPLGLAVNVIQQQLVWNVLNYRSEPAPAVDSSASELARVAILGGGSAGSSVAGVLTMLESARGYAAIVDPDEFDPRRNPYRYPCATGATAGPKAEWLADLLASRGWDVAKSISTVGEWYGGLSVPGFYGLAISSVDDLDGRLQVADVLAHTTLSLGINGLALHVQREHLGDGWACPYCEHVNVQPPLAQLALLEQQVGIDQNRLAQLLLSGDLLTESDLQKAVAAGKIRPESAPMLVGRRLQDLQRRVYADAVIPVPSGSAPTAISAPHVSWMTGVLAAAEVIKSINGIPMVDRRLDLDLSGLPTGFVLKRHADATGRCICASPVRTRWMRKLYGTATLD